MSRLVSIKFYKQISKAKRDNQLLKKNRITGFIANENLVQADHFLSQTVGGIQLQVFDVDVRDAVEILGIHKQKGGLFKKRIIRDSYKAPPVCLHCGSNRIFQIEKLGGIFSMGWYILGFPLETSKGYYYCYYCDGEFIS